MHKDKLAGRKRDCGTILTAAVLWGCAALAGAAVVLASANNIFENHNWQAVLLRRENTAMQAQALAVSWFASGIRDGTLVDASEFELSAAPKDVPHVIFPAVLLAELKKMNKNEAIEVSIIDQNYSADFKDEASKMRVPFSSPSEIDILSNGEILGAYKVKRYQICSCVSIKEYPERYFTLSKNILVLMDINENCNIIILYTKKQ